LAFESQARVQHEIRSLRRVPRYAASILRFLERDVFPELGSFRLDTVDAPLVVAMLRRIEARGSIGS
jgi:hypothetical protein